MKNNFKKVLMIAATAGIIWGICKAIQKSSLCKKQLDNYDDVEDEGSWEDPDLDEVDEEEKK